MMLDLLTVFVLLCIFGLLATSINRIIDDRVKREEELINETKRRKSRKQL